MQDAYNLAWKLDLVIRGRAPAVLLDSYEIERRPVARDVLFGTDRATRAAFLQTGVLFHARNKIAQVLTSFGAVQRKIATTASELDVNYRGSPIVGEDRSIESWVRFGRGPRPGERAPDVTLAGGERLHERLTGTSHVLLAFGVSCDLGPIQNRLGADLRVLHLSPEGEPARRYGAALGSLVLVRPDKYVGYRGEPAAVDRLDAFLSKIFV
jgi:hypothetical protein